MWHYCALCRKRSIFAHGEADSMPENVALPSSAKHLTEY